MAGQPLPREASEWDRYMFETGGWVEHAGTQWCPRVIWDTAGAALLQQWTEVYPGTRPPGFWRGGATEPRLQVAGPVRKLPDGWHDFEDWRQTDGLELSGRFTPPVDGGMAWEGTGSYLDRLGGWLEGERDRTPVQAWEPIKAQTPGKGAR
jgi:hypothetical protein